MNSNEELKFSPITKGNFVNDSNNEKLVMQRKKIMDDSSKLNGTRITSVKKSQNNDLLDKKTKKAIITVGSILLIYLVIGGVISTEAVNIKHDAKYVTSGSNMATIADIPKGEMLDKFIDVITDPMEYIETAQSVHEANKTR